LNDKKDIRREKKEKKRQKRKREEGRRFGEGTGGDASGHELSLVTTATNNIEKRFCCQAVYRKHVCTRDP